jgi:hypothetical protein
MQKRWTDGLLLTPQQAIDELRKRQTDLSLKKAVELKLQGDLPDYLRDNPIFYLARHIATPNFETLRFTHLISHLGLNPVIGYDSRGLFVSQNLIKRALCKLPICIRITQKQGVVHEQYRYETVVDFSQYDGTRFGEINTMSGEPLIEFHHRLFSHMNGQPCTLVDDAAWIDRHHRSNLLEHYKDLLSLFVVHGIFFESYNSADPHEWHFIDEILRPACEYVEQTFGHKPLIAEIFPTNVESYNFWISYPARTLDIIRTRKE